MHRSEHQWGMNGGINVTLVGHFSGAGIRDLASGIWDLASGIRHAGSGIRDPEPGIQDLQPGSRTLEPRIRDSGSRIKDRVAVAVECARLRSSQKSFYIIEELSVSTNH